MGFRVSGKSGIYGHWNLLSPPPPVSRAPDGSTAWFGGAQDFQHFALQGQRPRIQI